MIMRSAPPASTSFADRPVPAPAPTTRLLVHLCAQPRERLVAVHRAPSISSCSRSAIATANAGSFTSASIRLPPRRARRASR